MLQTIGFRTLRSRACSYTIPASAVSTRWASIWGGPARTPETNETAVSTDLIHLKGLTFHGYHGVLPEVCSLGSLSQTTIAGRLNLTANNLVQENLLGQKFVVDATLFVDLQKAGKSDNVHDTVSYADVYRYVRYLACCMLPVAMYATHLNNRQDRLCAWAGISKLSWRAGLTNCLSQLQIDWPMKF